MRLFAAYMQPITRVAKSRHGFSLVELLISTLIASIIVAGMQGTIFLTLRSVPDPNGIASTTLRASHIIDQLITELQTAIYVTERSPTTIGFVVPDRDNDGIGERVRYAWNGIPGGPLTRQYNSGTIIRLAEEVDFLSLTPSFKSVSETFPSVSVEDATESLLADLNGTNGTSDHDITLSNGLGQYFSTTLPAKSYAWRPTRVQLLARRNAVPGSTNIQLRAATAALTPANTSIQQFSMTDSSLLPAYEWKSFSYSDLDPLASGGAICLVLQNASGAVSATLQSTSVGPGLLQTTDNGSSWSYDSGKCLVTQLYGKQFRSTGTQSINSNYLISMDVAFRITNTSPTQRTTASFLNHPELVSGKWELQFDKNPTRLDENGDSLADWSVNGGGTFSMTQISDAKWQTSGTQLNTNPGSDFSKTTIVDLKFQQTHVGGNGATFSLNALRSGNTCAPVLVNLKKMSDGTQTMILSTKTSDSPLKTLINIAGLPSQPVLLHLVINPSTSSISICVNDVQYGNYPVLRYASADSNRFASIGASGSNVEYSYARIRILEQ